MKSFHFLFFTLIFSISVNSQVNLDHTWLLGTFGPGEPGEPDTRFGMNIFDFNDGGLDLSKEFMDVEFFVTNSSISDQNGQLLFFSNGCKVFNAEFEVMENGSGLNPGLAYATGNCPNSGNTVPSGLLILPLPNDENRYYIFHESGEFGTGVFSSHIAKLYYTLVDMEGDNGLGAVIEKNQVVLADTLSGVMHAIRHENGLDWWVMVAESHRDTYFKVLFTENGIEGVTEQSIGGTPDPFGSGGGQACFSPDGNRYARYVSGQSIYLFDFDRGTSELGNFQELFFVDSIPDFLFGGIAISPNSRFLYMCTTTHLWQFDLEAPDIQASRVLVGEYDGYEHLGFFKTYFFNMRLAPDCKIYMPSLNSSDILHVIHSPNKKGLDCNFVQHGFKLPAVNSASIPNFPNYRLGTGYPVCDSTIHLVVSSVQLPHPRQQVAVYPNPASGHATVEVPLPLTADGVWSLYSATGQRVFSQKLGKGQLRYNVPLAVVPPGLYFWEVRSEGRQVGSGKLVVSH